MRYSIHLVFGSGVCIMQYSYRIILVLASIVAIAVIAEFGKCYFDHYYYLPNGSNNITSTLQQNAYGVMQIRRIEIESSDEVFFSSVNEMILSVSNHLRKTRSRIDLEFQDWQHQHRRQRFFQVPWRLQDETFSNETHGIHYHRNTRLLRSHILKNDNGRTQNGIDANVSSDLGDSVDFMTSPSNESDGNVGQFNISINKSGGPMIMSEGHITGADNDIVHLSNLTNPLVNGTADGNADVVSSSTPSLASKVDIDDIELKENDVIKDNTTRLGINNNGYLNNASLEYNATTVAANKSLLYVNLDADARERSEVIDGIPQHAVDNSSTSIAMLARQSINDEDIQENVTQTEMNSMIVRPKKNKNITSLNSQPIEKEVIQSELGNVGDQDAENHEAKKKESTENVLQNGAINDHFENKSTDGILSNRISGDNLASEQVNQNTQDLQHEITLEERKIKIILIGGALMLICMMIFTAWQMSDHPDGIFANLCRLTISVVGMILSVILSPCRKHHIIGGGSHMHQPYGHVPLPTKEFGYNDPALEIS